MEGTTPLALVVRNTWRPAETTFLTPDAAPFQIGAVVYPPGGVVPRHLHLPLERRLTTTTEVIFIREGRCVAEVYGSDRKLVSEHPLAAGDMILFLDGGHAFRMIEHTVLIEVKQGPYTGLKEKERF
jgi:hypothetical protein